MVIPSTWLHLKNPKKMTMKTRLTFIGLLLSGALSAQINIGNIQNTINNAVNTVGNTINLNGVSLTNDEIIKGLKEALSTGATNAVLKGGALDGFYKNALIKIPFPPDAIAVKNTLNNITVMRPKIAEFEKSLNRAAEEATKSAVTIFAEAIKGITIQDGLTILKGADNAATKYLESKTTASLIQKFTPIVRAAIAKVQVTKYWKPLATRYNRLPLITPVNPNLEKYVTDKAVEGVFKLIAQEESKIRKDPAARVTDLLKKVFGAAKP